MTDDEIFGFVIKLALSEQEVYLRNNCADEEQLQRVQVRLATHRLLQEQSSADMPSTIDGSTRIVPGLEIGPYKLREKIGEGGMGIVYLAEQENPIRRKVALKLIKVGMDTKDVTARFEAERRALSIMDHPNIARVLDAGSNQQGRPYFVMELVNGIPITEYCDQHRLTLRERLELGIEVCRGVQHAHHKGIIHRDIKPSNVLVTEHDGRPVAKVIDFGVAKAIGQQLSDGSVYTHHLQPVGTLQYMSPEQSRLSGIDIDTRSDVYALGLLIYELLTGTLPFDRTTFDQATFDEKRRMIAEDEAPRPSKRISSLGEPSNRITTTRRTDRTRLSSELRGELDWILTKALDKDRSRRYASASDLGADIRRYLDGETVLACPPSAWYRMRKFARRNRGLVGSLLAVAVALMVGLGTTSYWWLEESKQARIVADVNLTLYRERYISDLIAAHEAIDGHNLRRALKLLQPYQREHLRHLRSWEWRYLWKLCMPAVNANWLPQPDCVLGVSFAPEGDILAMSRPDGIELFKQDVGRWESFQSYERFGWHGCYVRFSSDAAFMAYQKSETGGLVLIDRKSEQTATFDASGPFCFSNDGQQFAAIYDNQLVVCDTRQSFDKSDLQILSRINYPNEIATGDGTWQENVLAFSPDDRYLAIGLASGGTSLVDWQSAELEKLFLPAAQSSPVVSLCFDREGTKLLVGHTDGMLNAWDVSTSALYKSLRHHRDEIRSIKHSTEKHLFAVASRDNSISLISDDEFELVDILLGHSGICQDVAFSADGKLLASAGQDYAMGLWQLASVNSISDRVRLGDRYNDKVAVYGKWVYQQNKTAVYRRSQPVPGVANADEDESAFAEDVTLFDVSNSGLIVIGKQNGQIDVVDLITGNPMLVFALDSPPHLLTCCRINAGVRIAAADKLGTLKIWDYNQKTKDRQEVYSKEIGRLVNPLRNTEAWVAKFSHDGTLFAYADSSHALHLINMRTMQPLKVLPGHRDQILSIAISPVEFDIESDEFKVATGSFDNTARIWTLTKDDWTSDVLYGHSASVRGVQFLDNGHTLVTAGGDKTVKFWDTEALRERLTVSLAQPAGSISIAGDSQVVVGQLKGPLTVLDAATEAEIESTMDLAEAYIAIESQDTHPAQP